MQRAHPAYKSQMSLVCLASIEPRDGPESCTREVDGDQIVTESHTSLRTNLLRRDGKPKAMSKCPRSLSRLHHVTQAPDGKDGPAL